jgi:methyl-galactoside transport system substrate-binding protein
MKKAFALLLAMLMLFSLAACTTPAATPTAAPATQAPADDPAPPPPPADDGIVVDIFWYTFADTYLTSVRNAMIEQLDAAGGINYTMHDCQEDQALQLQMVETAITQGTDLLVVNIVTTGSEEAAQNIVDLASQNDLPIVFFNREVSDAVVNSYENCCFVGTDADEAGVMQGQAAAEFLLADENLVDGNSIYDLDGDGEISYLMFRGEHGNAEAFGRTFYSVTEANAQLALAGASFKLVPSTANETSTQYDDDGISNFFLYGNWSADTAAELMRTALAANSLTDGSIELILANNDDQAIGAIEAMNEEGFNTGAEGAGYIPVFGVDATSVAVDAISSGRMTGTILQDGPGMASCIVYLMGNVSAGNPVFTGVSAPDYNVDDGVNKVRIPYAIVS